jgi:hypothetical protein
VSDGNSVCDFRQVDGDADTGDQMALIVTWRAPIDEDGQASFIA